MRSVRLLPIAITLVWLLASPSFAQGAEQDAGMAEPTAARAETESLPLRLGKALVFGVVVSVLLLGGGMWQRKRSRQRSRMKPPRS